ncbi:MAG: glycosyltransferase family 2 protein [Candidatus Latescibacteria bacterium]|nr:glycosyltransferase family 2 protein [Candidatus Latescibacterota bacterium]
MLTISLIVITRNRPRDISRLMTAIAAQTLLPEEVIIVDASADSRTEKVVGIIGRESVLGNIRYIRAKPAQRQKTIQRNLGAANATGEIIAYLDDDTIPREDYLSEIAACFVRHQNAVGVAGYISFAPNPDAGTATWFDNSLSWRLEASDYRPAYREYQRGDWVCREYARTSLLRYIGLLGNEPPGWASPSFLGREPYYVPPDGEDHRIEYCSGAAMNWRSEVFQHCQFSLFFEGHAPFEEFEFCFRTLSKGEIYMASRARVTHCHSPAERPNMYYYGRSWIRNAWYTWCTRWPSSSFKDRWTWWATVLTISACRFGDVLRWRNPLAALSEGIGRIAGIASLMVNSPSTNRTPSTENREEPT